MIHLTKEEKVARFDSLQVAFKYAKEKYKDWKRMSDRRNVDGGVISAYNKGMSDAYESFIRDLERWMI